MPPTPESVLNTGIIDILQRVQILAMLTMVTLWALILKEIATKYILRGKNGAKSIESVSERLQSLQAEISNIRSSLSTHCGAEEEAMGSIGMVVQRVETMTNELFALHKKTNTDGIPVWYFPADAQKSIKDVLAKIATIESHAAKSDDRWKEVVRLTDRYEQIMERLISEVLSARGK